MKETKINYFIYLKMMVSKPNSLGRIFDGKLFETVEKTVNNASSGDSFVFAGS